MSEDNAASAGASDRREQPFLYPWNRRIRHLHGISLRNLNFASPTNRARGKTITDDEYNLKTHSKILAQSEQNALHASRSYDDLSKSKNNKEPGQRLQRVLNTQKSHDTTPRRPNAGKLRRRSTLHWVGASPRVRQQKLVDLVLDRQLDTWFSIHHAEYDEPIYISEVMEKSMNPSFSHFDLDMLPARILRSDQLEIKLWARNEQTEGYKLLVELSVNLQSLTFVGKSMDSFHAPLPQNCILFHLSDGVYTSFTDLPAETTTYAQTRSASKISQAADMSSYDALMKLANLDDCIQDAIQMQEKLEAEINALLEKNKQTEDVFTEVEACREKLKSTNLAFTTERKHVEQLAKRKAALQKSRDDRRQAMRDATESSQEANDLPIVWGRAIEVLRKDLERNDEASAGQIRRICEELLQIFPIDPIKNRTLQFTIRNIHLPNSVFDDTNRDEIAAALGYTSQLVHQLSLYLSVPLPYPIEPNASSSFIQDNISMSIAQRKFPLHPTNVNYKFEYGVFLLNKDTEFLMNRAGLRVLDIRHTLPNLKYLLYILTAGVGELPARRAGGIRGLWGGPLSPSLSRRGSEESVHSRQGSVDHLNGTAAPTSKGKEKDGDVHDPFTGMSHGVKGLPYRRSLLREAG